VGELNKRMSMAGAQGGYIYLKGSDGMDYISDGREKVGPGGRNDRFSQGGSNIISGRPFSQCDDTSGKMWASG
jgi:hypothetical protein